MKKQTANIERFLEVVSDEPSEWLNTAAQRQLDRNWLLRSAEIAVRVLSALEDKNLSQKQLAVLMGVTPQYINKVLRGRENLSLETISKLETALGIVLIYTTQINILEGKTYPSLESQTKETALQWNEPIV
jgi:ribosome-binding protein aMBF1 (putative translation factor)